MSDAEPQKTAVEPAVPPTAASTTTKAALEQQLSPETQPRDVAGEGGAHIGKQGGQGGSISPSDEATATKTPEPAADATSAQTTAVDTAKATDDTAAADDVIKEKEPVEGESAVVTAPASKAEGPDDTLAIEPSGGAGGRLTKMTSATSPVDSGPVCNITLLLPTGARHPYKIDDRYLAKRNVEIPDTTETGVKDPFSISVYKLKELILREWRDEWDGKPASPSSIRLIHFGKLLEDKEQLKKYHFSAQNPNMVHMSVRPAELLEEDEAGKGKSGGREGRNRDGSGNCCVIL